MNRPVRIGHVAGFVVRLTFTDDTQKDVVLEPYLYGPVCQSLRDDRQEFSRVRVDPREGTIVWDNGADIDPDVLYRGLVPAWREQSMKLSS